MAKHFVVNPKIERSSKETVDRIRREEETVLKQSEISKIQQNERKIAEEDNLRFVPGRVIVKINTDYKNFWTFEDGTKIRYERQFNNFNVRETNPVNAIVISGEGINPNSEILIHPNSIHESNRICDYKDSNDNVKYYSIEKDMCFAWYDGEKWQPIPPFDFALRIFKPYAGMLENIYPTQIKDTLWVTTGELKGNAVKTLIACDYQIVFQNREGREQSLIRFRPFGDEEKKREEEAICVLGDVTEKVLSGQYLIGLTLSDAKTL